MDRVEAAGLGVSVAGHAALLALLSLALVTAGNVPVSPTAMEVSFVDEVAMTSASPQPSPAPAAPATAPDLGPIEDAAPAPAPTPRQAETEEKPRPVAEEPVPAPPQQRRAEPRPAPPAPPGNARNTRRPGLGDIDPRSFGRDPAARRDAPPAATYGPEARASVRQAIARALARCQRQPLPTPEAAVIRVDYTITLNRDGSLAGARFVRVINPDPALAQYERRMRDLALNVINACTPIRGLPQEFYDVPGGWRQFPYQFDPRTVR
jgi:hypothetical protein